MGAPNLLTVMQAVSPEWKGSKLQVRLAVKGAGKKINLLAPELFLILPHPVYKM
jgi:hypothetical protein